MGGGLVWGVVGMGGGWVGKVLPPFLPTPLSLMQSCFKKNKIYKKSAQS